MSIETLVKHFKMRDLSGEEVENLIGKAPVDYASLGKYKNLNELLGKENYCVVLYDTSSKGVGHYIALTRNEYDGKVRYFDSYGIPNPDVELQFTPYDEQLPKYLTKLLEPYDFESNRVDYQSKKSGVSTCGRFASIACMFRNLSLAQIQELFKTNKSDFLKDVDNTAVMLTMVGLNNIEDYLTKIPRGRTF